MYVPGQPKKPDPAMRSDKLCAYDECHEGPNGGRGILEPITLKHNDPFCSTQCCKAYHHVAQGTGS